MTTGKLRYAGFARPSLGFFDDLENVEIKVKVFGLRNSTFVDEIMQLPMLPGRARLERRRSVA